MAEMTSVPGAESDAKLVPWHHAANEIEDEAQVRGDLDQRTVEALAKRLRTLGKGHDTPHVARRSAEVGADLIHRLHRNDGRSRCMECRRGFPCATFLALTAVRVPEGDEVREEDDTDYRPEPWWRRRWPR